jgi:hypothetical protein
VLPDPHHHVVDVSSPGLLAEVLPDFRIVAVRPPAELARDEIVLNAAGTYRAFAGCDESCRVFFEVTASGDTFEILGLPLPGRPFSGLVWVTDDILVFDRWSQPHYGLHYAVDVRARSLLLAAPFPDEAPAVWVAFTPTSGGYEAVILDTVPDLSPAGPLLADLDADGAPETVYWEGERVRVERGGETVWESEPAWRVVDVAVGDFFNDYRQEVLLAMWKDDTAGVPRSHPFIMGHRHGRYDLLWGGSAVADPIRDLDLGDVDGDGRNELVVLEGAYEEPEGAPARFVTVWRWNGWGFTLLWRSAEGRYDSLGVGDVDGDGVSEAVVRQR